MNNRNVDDNAGNGKEDVMYGKILMVAMVVAALVSPAHAQRVTVEKSDVVPVSEIKDSFDYSRCGVAYARKSSNERVRAPQGAEFHAVVVNDFPLGCVQARLRVVGADLVTRQEILLPGQEAIIGVDPNAFDWDRAAKTGVKVGVVAGALCGILSGGNVRERLGNAGKCGAGGVIVGGVIGGSPRDRRGRGDIVQMELRVLDETGATLSTRCLEYRINRNGWNETQVIIADETLFGDNAGMGGRRATRGVNSCRSR